MRININLLLMVKIPMRYKFPLAALALALSSFSPLLAGSAQAQEGTAPVDDRFLLSVGYYDVFDNDDTAADFRLEYRSNLQILPRLMPFAGVEATSDGAVFGLAGLLYDYEVTDNWYVTPSVGAGLYSDGDGKDLGGALQFRSQIEVSYELESGHRVGTSFSHISNAGIKDENPGTEVIGVSYSVPTAWIF